VFDPAVGLAVGWTIETGRNLARDLFGSRRSPRD